MGVSLLRLFLFVCWASHCKCLVHDVVRDTAWPEDEAGTSCIFVTDGQLVLQPGCFAASTVSGEALRKLRDEEGSLCGKFAQGEFYQLDFSIRREDSTWCTQILPSPILTTLGVNEQTVVKVLSNYGTEPQSFTFVTSLEDTAPLDVSFTSLFVDQTAHTQGDNQCLSQIVLFNVTLQHIPQPCKADIALVNVVQDEMLVEPGAAGDAPTEVCALLGTPDAVILRKINIAPPHATSNTTMSRTSAVRVFCGIYTTAAEHSTRIHTMRTTWGHKCSTFLAFSTTTDPSVPSVYVPHIGEEKYTNMWQKIRSIWKYIYAHYRGEYDYFLLCGDDTFYIMENLHAYLNSDYMHNLRLLDQGLFIGRKLHSPAEHLDVIFNSGGAGYLLDQRALQILMSHIDSERCRAHVLDEAAEDVNVARCLAGADPPVLPIDTRDEQGERHISCPEHHIRYPCTWYVIYIPRRAAVPPL